MSLSSQDQDIPPISDKSVRNLCDLQRGEPMGRLSFSPATLKALGQLDEGVDWNTMSLETRARVLEIQRYCPSIFQSGSASVAMSDISSLNTWPTDPNELPQDALHQRQARTWVEFNSTGLRHAQAAPKAAPGHLRSPVTLDKDAVQDPSSSPSLWYQPPSPPPPLTPRGPLRHTISNMFWPSSRPPPPTRQRRQHHFPSLMGPGIPSSPQEPAPSTATQNAASLLEPPPWFSPSTSRPNRTDLAPEQPPRHPPNPLPDSPPSPRTPARPALGLGRELDALVRRHREALGVWKERMRAVLDAETQLAAIEQETTAVTLGGASAGGHYASHGNRGWEDASGGGGRPGGGRQDGVRDNDPPSSPTLANPRHRHRNRNKGKGAAFSHGEGPRQGQGRSEEGP